MMIQETFTINDKAVFWLIHNATYQPADRLSIRTDCIDGCYLCRVDSMFYGLSFGGEVFVCKENDVLNITCKEI